MLLLVGILLPSPEHIFTETDVITNALENGGDLRGRELEKDEAWRCTHIREVDAFH